VVDTNVPIVANGHPNTSSGSKVVSVDCRIAAVKFLQTIVGNGTVLLDIDGEIQAEYRRHLNPDGQPGVGDRFFLTIINSAPHLVERLDLPKRLDGEYIHIPQDLIDARFDPSDRKFAALAAKERVPVMNTTDSDWLQHRELLNAVGINVKFLCGCDPACWFDKL
jgi:hypothetical protein